MPSCAMDDRKLFQMKLHYVFFFGAMAGVVPFLPMITKGLGFNATANGIIFTVLPVCIFLAKPLFGYLTDRFQNFRLIIFILILVSSISFISILLVPKVDTIRLECTDSNELLLYPQQYDELCLTEVLKQGTVLNPHFRECDIAETSVGTDALFDDTLRFESKNSSETNDNGCTSKVQLNELINCTCIATGLSSIRDNLTSCFCGNKAATTYICSTYQFWVFTLLAVLGGSGGASVFSLTDAACYEVLGDRRENFGRQRLWATASWGLVTLAAGYLNDLSTSSKGEKDYSAGFYLMVALVLVDLAILLKFKVPKAKYSINICKDVRKIFASYETVIFAIAVYVAGALTALIWNSEFWFLQDLGATPLLLGLAVAVQCLAAEVPMFFFSGWFINTFGHFYCLTGSFAAFALRFFSYCFLKNPWIVLPIEMTHGITYALFFASMTSYASNKAPAGTEATMLGILEGIFEGLGVATGSLLGGYSYDKIGGHNLYWVAAVVSLICTPILPVSQMILRRTSSSDETQAIATDTTTRYDGEAPESEAEPST